MKFEDLDATRWTIQIQELLTSMSNQSNKDQYNLLQEKAKYRFFDIFNMV